MPNKATLEIKEFARNSDEGWNATFFVTGRMHSIAGGWANAPTPWRAVQRAGWDAIQHAERFV